MNGPAAPAPAPAPGPCANCGAAVAERWCSRCGQDRGLTPHVPVGEILGEALGEALSVDSRMGRTVLPFFFRPGFLTAEYLAGRRVRYSSPLRLYLLTTVVFFLVASTGGLGAGRAPGSGDRLFRVGFAGGAPAAPPAEAGATTVARAAAETGAAVETIDLYDRAPERQHQLDEQLAELRRGGLFSRLLADRLETLRHLPQDEANRRMGQSLLQQAPRVLFFLVPVMAALLALLHRRSGLFYAEHLVFALHAHALGFALLVPGQLGPAWLGAAGAGATALHLLLAMRRVYRRPWPGTAWRFLVLTLLYLVALGLGMAAASLLALALL